MITEMLNCFLVTVPALFAVVAHHLDGEKKISTLQLFDRGEKVGIGNVAPTTLSIQHKRQVV